MDQIDSDKNTGGSILDHSDVSAMKISVDYNQPPLQALEGAGKVKGDDEDVLAAAPCYYEGKVERAVSFFPIYRVPLHYRLGHQSIPLDRFKQFFQDFNLRSEDLYTAAAISKKGSELADMHSFSILWESGSPGSWYRAEFREQPRNTRLVKVGRRNKALTDSFCILLSEKV